MAELNEDTVTEVISHLPLKFAVQCKRLSKNLNRRISDVNFSQKMSTLIYYSLRNFHKISTNPPISGTHCTTPRLDAYADASVSASCKGLLLLRFPCLNTYCVFNPITGSRQLIPLPEHLVDGFRRIAISGFAVDYPASDAYKLVMVGELGEGGVERGYKFHVFSSDRLGSSWREFQFRMNNFSYLAVDSKPVYAHGSLHWLRNDGTILAFDPKREVAVILDVPHVLKNHDAFSSAIKPGFDTWFGMSRDYITLIRIFTGYMAVASYNYARHNWRVSYSSATFIKYMIRYPINYGFPIWIDGKLPLFFVQCPQIKHRYYLYEYDFEINGYKRVEVWNKDFKFEINMSMFEPTLASVHTTLIEDSVPEDYRLSAITEALDALGRLITEGVMENSMEQDVEATWSSSP